MRSEVRKRGWVGFAVSHPCAEKLAHGWGTGHLVDGKSGNAGPSASPSLRSGFAQDDREFALSDLRGTTLERSAGL